MPLVDPKVLARLPGMWLRARVVVEGAIAGLHHSPFRGFSLDFAEHRAYTPGDELKHLDWKVLGRTDRYVVKQYQEETNLRGMILLDTSASMAYPADGVSKRRYGAMLSAALAFLMIRQSDAVGLGIFDGQLRKHLPPGGTHAHLKSLMDVLEQETEAGTPAVQKETHIAAVLRDLGAKLTRRGLLVLVSDLYDDEAEIVRALQEYRFRRHEVIVFHVLSPAELSLPGGEATRFEGLEAGDCMTSPPLIREAYRKLVLEFSERFRLRCREHGIDYQLVRTDSPLELVLGQFLARRRTTT